MQRRKTQFEEGKGKVFEEPAPVPAPEHLANGQPWLAQARKLQIVQSGD